MAKPMPPADELEEAIYCATHDATPEEVEAAADAWSIDPVCSSPIGARFLSNHPHRA
jgi:hypothetical protein